MLEASSDQPLEYADLVIIDDILPSDFSPFRSIEYKHYLSFFDARLLSLEGWHLWISNGSFGRELERLPIEYELKRYIAPFKENMRLAARLAYITFLGNATRLMPYLESRNLPFIMQLYPGGGFEVDQLATDEKLKRVLLSELCRKVIVTQKITQDYIVEKIGCDKGKVEMIFGGVFESRIDFEFHRDKRIFGRDKNTIDLCFVAHKYGDDLVSKGYDSFVEIASRLYGNFHELRFHVVGDYQPNDIPLGPVGDLFTFYGKQPSAFFEAFYPGMDAIVSVNRPFKLAPGAFDGFPTGACIEAGFRGVLNCISDPLKLNPVFINGEDILLIEDDPDSSSLAIGSLLQDPHRLYDLAYRNYVKFHKIFSTDAQLWARSRLIVSELTRHVGLVTAHTPRGSHLDAGISDEAQLLTRLAALEQRQSLIERTQAIVQERSTRLTQIVSLIDPNNPI